MWNVRGMNKKERQREVRDLKKKEKPDETKIRENKSAIAANSIWGGIEYLINYDSNPSGRIWVMWDLMT
jgi:hypothetical protein